MARAEIEAFIAKHQLVFTSKFIPFSRAGGEKMGGMPTLNWDVTVSNGRYSFTTRFTSGAGHCPSYQQDFGHTRTKRETKLCVEEECERGVKCVYVSSTDRAVPKAVGKPHQIEPDPVTFLDNLASDAQVLDCPTFETWADQTDRDTDSRQAERDYQACLGIALKLKHLVGWEGLVELKKACQDF